MTPPEPGDAGNPFQSLLGDLMNMLGTNAPDHWEMTRSFALNVATGGAAEANVEPIRRIQLEQLSRVAELNVTEATGMPVSPDGRRLTCVPVGRGDWTLRALESWRPILTAMAPAAGPVPEPPRPDQLDPSVGEDPTDGLAGLLGQWATAIGPMFFGLQIGSVVGHLSHRALGQYPVAIPWAPSDELVIVPVNIAAFAEDWSLPEEEALLWICSRELASHSVLSRPAIRARMEELLADMVASTAAAQQDVAGRLQALSDPDSIQGTGMDLESLQGMFGDPEALLGELLTPETRRSSERLTAAAIVIDAYADHIAEVVGQKLVGSHGQLAEAFYRRRIERGKGEEAAGALFGLDLDRAEVDRGRSFVSGVVERAGEEGLSKLWSSASNLPTPSEVDAPGLWLERISLPELDEPG
ncbi:MAG TPA: zinc-dependent metalloprotease [Acidimicrobiales bacterium]|jgi:putative hydrolase|nr:zinc-dependent metalloprotease [Acidimicrobiales bacterium]